jgi:hypothetical protein
VTAGRAVSERTLEVRYEAMVTDPEHAAREIATHLGVDATELLRRLAAAHDRSIGRFARDLGADQLADVESEAGPLLRELGYAS